jgi:hypothetical protein
MQLEFHRQTIEAKARFHRRFQIPQSRSTILRSAGANRPDLGSALNPWAAYRLHFALYNFCRAHHKLRVTPAMEAGITNKVGDIGEVLAA